MKFNLTPEQIARYKEWAERVITPEDRENYDHETSPCSPFIFSFVCNGEGDLVHVHYGNQTLDLTQDSDGNFLTDLSLDGSQNV